MDRLNPVAVGASAAITLVFVNIICVAVLFLWPGGALDFFSSFMHGLDIEKVKATAPLTAGRFIYGLVALAVIGFVTGLIYAGVHNVLGGARPST